MQIEEVKTLQEADALAKNLYGQEAFTRDLGRKRTPKAAHWQARVPQFFVGNFVVRVYGYGDTWQAAFVAAAAKKGGKM